MPIGPAPDWQDVTWMVGQYAGSPIVIAVDADGKIINVMQATYAGVLKSVACDADGRIIMIPTDPADIWGNAISMGNAELAARIGKVIPYDKRGESLFVEDFGSGLNRWQSVTDGTLASVSTTSEESAFGGLAAKLIGGSDASQLASIVHTITKPKVSKVGLEVGARILVGLEYLVVGFEYQTAAGVYYAYMRYSPVTDKVQYYSSTPAWVDLLTGISLTATIGLFHPIKLVVDLNTKKYHRLLVQGAETDMSALSLYVDTGSSGAQLIHRIEAYSLITLNGGAYINPVIITQNEPA